MTGSYHGHLFAHHLVSAGGGGVPEIPGPWEGSNAALPPYANDEMIPQPPITGKGDTSTVQET